MKSVRLIALSFCLMSVCFLYGFCSASYAERVLQGGVSFSEEDVPFELYGHWERTRHLVGSSTPKLFNTVDKGAWDISLTQGRVVLTNPSNGLSVPMEVANVRGKETTFTYRKELSKGRWCEETLTLEPAGDMLQGFQEKVCYRPLGYDDQHEQYFFASAVVEGFRHREVTKNPDSNVLPPLL